MKKESINYLGPLAALSGVWEGIKGNDIAPSDDRGTETNKFRERIVFEPISKVENHEQVLHGLRYSTTAWRLGEDLPFHEELGYWLWDSVSRQVLRCFTIPRGVVILAGGTVEQAAKTFELSAKAGSETYGICSNKFLDKEFKTVQYHLKVTVHDKNSFTYEEDTVLKMKGRSKLFHHTDANTLRRVVT